MTARQVGSAGLHISSITKTHSTDKLVQPVADVSILAPLSEGRICHLSVPR